MLFRNKTCSAFVTLVVATVFQLGPLCSLAKPPEQRPEAESIPSTSDAFTRDAKKYPSTSAHQKQAEHTLPGKKPVALSRKDILLDLTMRLESPVTAPKI